MTQNKENMIKALVEGFMKKDKNLTDSALNAIINNRIAEQIKKVCSTEKLV